MYAEMKDFGGNKTGHPWEYVQDSRACVFIPLSSSECVVL